MGAMDRERCRHCVSPAATITPAEDDGFARPGSACICFRCDRSPHPVDATFVPYGWER